MSWWQGVLFGVCIWIWMMVAYYTGVLKGIRLARDKLIKEGYMEIDR